MTTKQRGMSRATAQIAKMQWQLAHLTNTQSALQAQLSLIQAHMSDLNQQASKLHNKLRVAQCRMANTKANMKSDVMPTQSQALFIAQQQAYTDLLNTPQPAQVSVAVTAEVSCCLNCGGSCAGWCCCD